MKVLPEIAVYVMLIYSGFTSKEAHTMTCIAKYESGLRPDAVNLYNANNTIDLGLFQINSIHWQRLPECSMDTLQNPINNIQCSYSLYKESGYNIWYGYRYNKQTCDNYEVKL